MSLLTLHALLYLNVTLQTFAISRTEKKHMNTAGIVLLLRVLFSFSLINTKHKQHYEHTTPEQPPIKAFFKFTQICTVDCSSSPKKRKELVLNIPRLSQ